MKTLQVDNPSKLTKWLLIVTLLWSLLACLGGDIISQSGLSISPKTELALATKPGVKPVQSVLERPRPSTFYTSRKSSHFTSLVVYNGWVIRQLKLVRLTTFTFTGFACLLPTKTIPASTDEPSSGSVRG